MWIFTPNGFFSAVEHRDDSSKIMVRCRAKAHARRLVEIVSSFSDREKPSIVETPYPADYHWRVTITRQDWAQFVAWSALGIDYVNFKNEVARHPQPDGFMIALHRVWSELLRVQDRHHPPPKLSPLKPKKTNGTALGTLSGDADEWLTGPWPDEAEPLLEIGMAVTVPEEPELGVGCVDDISQDGTAQVAFFLKERDANGNVTEDEVVLNVDIDKLEIVPEGWELDELGIDPEVVDAMVDEIEAPNSGRPEPETYDSLDEYEWDGSWPEPVAGGTLKGR